MGSVRDELVQVRGSVLRWACFLFIIITGVRWWRSETDTICICSIRQRQFQVFHPIRHINEAEWSHQNSIKHSGSRYQNLCNARRCLCAKSYVSFRPKASGWS
jgi:hypothetical protein